MTEERGLNLSYSAQQIEELLRCSVCLDRFTSPKVLPCQHTFCETPCLQQLVTRFHQIKCPECRAEHRVPYAGVSAFPTNRTLLNFLDLPAQATPIIPQTSNQTAADTGRAEQNNQPANQATGDSPRQRNNSRNANAREQAPAAERTSCSSCSRQVSLSRCPHCDGIICDTCKRSHIDQLRLDINRIVGQLRRGLPSFSEAISVVENKSEQLHQRAEAGKAEITEMIERHISELRNRQRALHSEVQMWLLGEIRSLRMCQENVEVELASTASFCDSTEALLLRANQTIPDDDLVDIKRQCVEHMESIRAYENGAGIRLPRERQVQLEFEGDRFSQAISNFGELCIVDRQSNGNGGSDNSGPSSVNSQSSSSREQSPMVTPLRPGTERSSGPSQRSGPGLDTALQAIGSVPVATPRGPESPVASGGASAAGSTDVGRGGRTGPRERMATLLSDSGATGLSPRTSRRDRTAGMMGGGGETSVASSSPQRRPVQPSMSWELPVDFSHPPRSNIRAGNDGQPAGRRSLQERRRHNLSDTRLPASFGGLGTRNSRQTDSQSSPVARRRNNSGDQTSGSQSHVASSNGDRPPMARSRTYTREDFQTIREEDNVSRASTADPVNRPRDAIRFEVDLSSDQDGNTDVPYQIGQIDGGDSTRVNVARNNYQDKGRAIIRFGSRGSDSMEFIWPRGIAVSRIDQMYIADSSNHRVSVFDNIGNFIKTFGSYGQADGEFDCLAGIAINSMGDILITDRYNHRIQVFDSRGVFKHIFGEEGQEDGQMSYPWGIATDSMGFIYVCDKENHRVQVFQANGSFVRKFGRLGRQIGQFENPHYLAISQDGKVYVSDSSNHRIQVFSMYGDYIFSFGSVGTMQGQMKYPKGIAIDEQGFVVVADSGNNRIQVFRGDGRFYSMFGGYGSDSGQFKGLEGLAILANGNVVISDRENHRIQIF